MLKKQRNVTFKTGSDLSYMFSVNCELQVKMSFKLPLSTTPKNTYYTYY